MRRYALTSLAAAAVLGILIIPARAVETDSSALPPGCRYEGPLGYLDVVDVADPAKKLAARAPLTEAQRRLLDMHDYASMVISKAAELNPGFPGSPHVRSLAISSESDRKQADVEVTIEWRTGEDDDISGRAVIGATKCGEGHGRLTTISVEFNPQDQGNGSSPIAVKPTAARDRQPQILN